jgi:hypothetical protein
MPIVRRNNFVYATLNTCIQGGMDSTLYTKLSSTQNNKYQVSRKHSCFSWWWAYVCPKYVEIDKYTTNKLHTKLVLFTRLYRDARSTKLKILQNYPRINPNSGSHVVLDGRTDRWAQGYYEDYNPFRLRTDLKSILIKQDWKAVYMGLRWLTVEASN